MSIVNAPTRGESHLDHILTRNVIFDNIKVIKPVTKSDHMAVLAYNSDSKVCVNKERDVYALSGRRHLP